jgi:hypothetical protein
VKVRETDVYEVWKKGNVEFIRYKPEKLPSIPNGFDENKLIRTPAEATGLIESYAKYTLWLMTKARQSEFDPLGVSCRSVRFCTWIANILNFVEWYLVLCVLMPQPMVVTIIITRSTTFLPEVFPVYFSPILLP